ncbi:MAG: protease complex subunit PrcB family protein [Panacagrimonas sp.]
MRSLAPLCLALAAGLLGACAKPAWLRMPDVSAPDFSSWFGGENAILVEEVVRANVCNTADSESEVSVLPDLVALKAWASGRGVDLKTVNNEPLPEGQPFAVVELGQRPHGGYSLAVSRQAGLRDEVLVLKATIFEPQHGRWASDEPISPCVVVSLPLREYRVVRLVDQTGRVRTATEGRGS